MTSPAAAPPPSLAEFTDPALVPAALRAELADCWTQVVNAGGAVVSAGMPMPPLTAADVAPEVARLVDGLNPARLRLLTLHAEGGLAGWLVLLRDPRPLVAHVGTVHHVQTRPERRGRGYGVALMRHAETVARDGMGLERLRLSARSGLGLERFYAGLGWQEAGRWPGALRVAPGDDRDDVLMHLVL